ncbi:MOSC domain-containing protein [Nonomuraea ferruginea]
MTHRVAVLANGLAGDERADKPSHGSPGQAVYAYAREDYDWWERELGRELRDGRFGENLTTSGLDVNGALIGERWRIGSTLLEVAAPRVPCVVFRNWLDEPRWVKRFTEAARPGAYLRVLELGELGVGDEVEVLHRLDGERDRGRVLPGLPRRREAPAPHPGGPRIRRAMGPGGRARPGRALVASRDLPRGRERAHAGDQRGEVTSGPCAAPW